MDNELFEKDREAWVDKMLSLLEEGRLNEIDVVNLRVILTEMTFSRSRAYRKLDSLSDQITEHLLLVCALPRAVEISHWLKELEAWRNKLAQFNVSSKKGTPNYSLALLNKYFWIEPFSEEGDLERFFKLMDHNYPDLKQAIDGGVDMEKFKRFVNEFNKSILHSGNNTIEIFNKIYH